MPKAKYDLRDPDFLANPAPMLEKMRADGPLVRVKLPLLGELWFTTTYAGAREVLKDQEHFSRDPVAAGKKPMERMFWWMPRFMAPLMQNLVLKDGVEHKRLRSLVDQAFARSSIADLKVEITNIADELLDNIDADKPVEIIAAYTRELPLLVICALLGVPEADRRKIARWIAPISSPTGLTALFTALPGLWKTMRHFRKDFEIVRRTGRPGLINDLVHANDGGDQLTEDELVAMVFTLFVAGHETTVHLITDAIVGLTDHPDQRSALLDNWDNAGIAIEEFMRFFSPVMMSKAHFVKKDMDFHGTSLKRGDQVSALLIGANHDPERFNEPDGMQLDRRPNAHLGFGSGPHVCLGMQLARAETQIALERLFTRFPDLQLNKSREKVVHSRRLGIRGFPRLDLNLRP